MSKADITEYSSLHYDNSMQVVNSEAHAWKVDCAV